MSRKVIAILIIIMASAMLVPNVLADWATLPASSWYAVVHQSDDTLHWINAEGEQASIPRPTWADENPNVQAKLHITPDGRTLIQVVQIMNGRQQIGFHNLETGTLIASHEAQQGERFVWSDDSPSLMFTARFAIGLTAPDVSQWRIIVFDTMTGAAVDQLTMQESGLLLPGNSYFPYVLHYELDEGLAQLIVNFQMRNAAGEAYAYEWRPETNDNAVVTGSYSFSPNDGYDIEALTDTALFGENNQTLKAVLNGVMTQIISEAGQISHPTWLNQSQWIAYQYQDGVFAPHWRLGLAQANTSIVPLGANIDAVYSTPDGFLARDAQNNSLMHSTSLPVEGHQAQIGNIVFNLGSDFEVIYVTPWGANFNLENVFFEYGINDNNFDLAAPECANAPESRLEIGMRARVTYTDGTPLRVRTAPDGSIITEIAEGTGFDIVGGSQCSSAYRWWQIQLDDNTVGWSAEGIGESYFIEQVFGLAPPPAQPTQVLDLAPPPVQPTQMQIAPPPVQATQMVFVAPAICSASPVSRLAVGDYARTDTSGTLAMRINISDATPTYQVPDNVTVLILEGSQCSANGQRMWRVRTTVNNQSVEGWLAEGWQSTYFLIPGPARAS